MPVSANFNTCQRIIQAACENAALVQEGDDPSSELYVKCMNRLNDLVNFFQTQGIKLWLTQTYTISLVAGTASYTLGPGGTGTKEMRILEGYFVDQNNISRPLDLLSWNTYGALSNKTQMGPLNSFFVDKQAYNTVVWTWLVPDATAALGTLQVLCQYPVANLVSLTDTMVFPNEWYMALHWGLAAEIATGQPDPIVKRCEQRAEMYRQALEDWDVSDASTSFAPNTDGQASSFR